MVVEFWLMRVLLHPGPMRTPLRLDELNPSERRTVLAHVERGEMTTLPDGCIAEPWEQYRAEMDAHLARERMVRDRPNDDWRVVLNSSLDSGEVA